MQFNSLFICVIALVVSVAAFPPSPLDKRQQSCGSCLQDLENGEKPAEEVPRGHEARQQIDLGLVFVIFHGQRPTTVSPAWTTFPGSTRMRHSSGR